jgi:hypothetical protein
MSLQLLVAKQIVPNKIIALVGIEPQDYKAQTNMIIPLSHLCLKLLEMFHAMTDGSSMFPKKGHHLILFGWCQRGGLHF